MLDKQNLVKLSVILGLILCIFVSSGAAEYVGVAPGVKDLGTLEKGERYKVEFYLVTNIDDTFTVRPSYSRPNPQIYMKESRGRYNFIPSEASQEDIESWLRFPESTIAVDPSTEQIISLQQGGVANAKGSVEFFIRVPKDAEPGYHAGAIEVSPKLNVNAGGGAAVQTLGLSQFVFVFKVPGEAQRSLNVLDVNALRTNQDKVRFDYLLKNNGTVTVRVNRADTTLYNQFGNSTGVITTGGNYIEPGQTKVVNSYWKGNNVEAGDFRVRGEMNYLTGNSFIDKTISVSDYVQIQSSSENGDTDSGDVLPWWLVVMLLALLGVIMYYFEIDPVWIAGLMGFLTVSAFVLFFNLPVYLIGIFIILGAIIVLT